MSSKLDNMVYSLSYEIVFSGKNKGINLKIAFITQIKPYFHLDHKELHHEANEEENDDMLHLLLCLANDAGINIDQKQIPFEKVEKVRIELRPKDTLAISINWSKGNYISRTVRPLKGHPANRLSKELLSKLVTLYRKCTE